MTTKRIILFLTPVMLTLTSFIVLTIQVYFSGNISSTNQDIKSQLIGLHFFVKSDKKIIAKTVIDTTRNYSINFTPGEEISFDFYITGFGIDTILLKSYRTFTSDIITWNIELPIKHKKILGKAICPKCNKTDLTYPIVYTDPPIVKQTIKNGDTIISCIVNNKYYADTDVHGLLSPSWYCKRDNVKY